MPCPADSGSLLYRRMQSYKLQSLPHRKKPAGYALQKASRVVSQNADVEIMIDNQQITGGLRK
jgi:hypothetical protein